MDGFFTGRKESITVDMHDGLWPGMQAEQDVSHGKKIIMIGWFVFLSWFPFIEHAFYCQEVFH